MNIITPEQVEGISIAAGQYDVRDQLKRHVYERATDAFRKGDAARDAITTLSELRARQRFIRRQFLKSIGGLPEGGSLNARTTGRVEGEGFQVEKVIFESRPEHYVTANLYLPHGLERPTGAVLFLCGHHAEGKHTLEYQSVCQTFAGAGLIVLAQDPIGQGERFSYYDAKQQATRIGPSVAEHEYAGAQCIPLGHSLARYFLHDAMRSVDYLLSRPEVDARSIGVTGNSGGGTQTAMLMMADPRVAAAAPGTFIMNRETYMWAGRAQDAEQIWPGFTAHGLDHEDILLAMCPKPVRVLAVTWDFFPIEGTRRTVDRCLRSWDIAGKPSALDLVEDTSVHKYTPLLAGSAAEFFARHLLKREIDLAAIAVAPFEPSQLWCTKSGQVSGELKGARFAHASNREEVQAAREKRMKMPPAQRAGAARKELRQKVMANRRKCALTPRFIPGFASMEGLTLDSGWWWSQENIVNTGLLLRAAASRDEILPVTIAVWDGGCTQVRPHLDWIHKQCARGRAVFIAEPTGVGSIEARPLVGERLPRGLCGVNHKMCDDLAWLDDSLPAMRVWDVLRALDVLSLWPGLDASDIEGYAHGGQGLYLQLAAALDERLRKVKVVGEIGSYEKWINSPAYDDTDIKSVLLPGILPKFDLPDLAIS